MHTKTNNQTIMHNENIQMQRNVYMRMNVGSHIGSNEIRLT